MLRVNALVSSIVIGKKTEAAISYRQNLSSYVLEFSSKKIRSILMLNLLVVNANLIVVKTIY